MRAIQAETNCSRRLATIDVVDQEDLHLLGHAYLRYHLIQQCNNTGYVIT
jgi:hypothetical protein